MLVAYTNITTSDSKKRRNDSEHPSLLLSGVCVKNLGLEEGKRFIFFPCPILLSEAEALLNLLLFLSHIEKEQDAFLHLISLISHGLLLQCQVAVRRVTPSDTLKT